MSKVLYYFITFLSLRKKSLFLYLIFKAKLKTGLVRKYVYNQAYGNELYKFSVGSHKHDTNFKNHTLNAEILNSANEISWGVIRLFKSNKTIKILASTDWFAFPEHSVIKPWYELSVNDVLGHDIKLTWEPSRFNWIYDLGLAYKVSGDVNYITAASHLFKSWLDINPYNNSINWVCAQECSIRALNILLFLDHIDAEINGDIYDFFKMTVDRVALTLDYSIAQDNNHSITESAAIFILSTFLLNSTYARKDDKIKYQLLANKGKKTLVNSVNDLTLDDGGFAMYSANYQRVVLTVLTLVECYRRTYSLPDFSEQYLNNCKALVLSLHDIVDLTSGHSINLGANDGTILFFNRLGSYLDYRPAIQTASYFFIGKLIYNSESANTGLYSLGIDTKDVGYYFDSFSIPESKNYRSWGLTKYQLSIEDCFLFIKYPSYVYRPSQCDLFHMDIWIRGINYLLDLGSYSYNDSGSISSDLSSISAHNTVCVDDIEPMPRLGRFLLGCWPKTDQLDMSHSFWSGEYKSIFGYIHSRNISIDGACIYITDTLHHVKNKVSLNFNLPLSNWSLYENIISNDDVSIEVEKTSTMDINLMSGFESKFYNQVSRIAQFKVVDYPKNETVIIKTKITIKEAK
ncbi:heparinase II/III family protein [Aeromonas hydrophila]|uniref:heparinase II/III domain-containing protein n=1 Tax=Aeromonas hydrophila TaxID=644 RepID=UPI00191C944C|nr:heparinase II/III family protein [Aeromonas hydrophila]MBL0433128.1 heparinase II/III family protein [Aeromonas hydrophila]MBL0469077.1 heparinase II/III family protein [Aeromonas hydrophila]